LQLELTLSRKVLVRGIWVKFTGVVSTTVRSYQLTVSQLLFVHCFGLGER
jgi:hypothetical protein